MRPPLRMRRDVLPQVGQVGPRLRLRAPQLQVVALGQWRAPLQPQVPQQRRQRTTDPAICLMCVLAATCVGRTSWSRAFSCR